MYIGWGKHDLWKSFALLLRYFPPSFLIVSYIYAQGTVEEKIMLLQQRKTEMAQSALEAKSKTELQRIRLEDLHLLFS